MARVPRPRRSRGARAGCQRLWRATRLATIVVTSVATSLTASVAALLVLSAQPSLAQERVRINRLIEALEQGGSAISSDVWVFIDQEHGPYLIDQLGTRLRDLAESKTDSDQ
jgi:hypothetical protein